MAEAPVLFNAPKPGRLTPLPQGRGIPAAQPPRPVQRPIPPRQQATCRTLKGPGPAAVGNAGTSVDVSPQPVPLTAAAAKAKSDPAPVSLPAELPSGPSCPAPLCEWLTFYTPDQVRLLTNFAAALPRSVQPCWAIRTLNLNVWQVPYFYNKLSGTTSWDFREPILQTKAHALAGSAMPVAAPASLPPETVGSLTNGDASELAPAARIPAIAPKPQEVARESDPLPQGGVGARASGLRSAAAATIDGGQPRSQRTSTSICVVQ